MERSRRTTTVAAVVAALLLLGGGAGTLLALSNSSAQPGPEPSSPARTARPPASGSGSPSPSGSASPVAVGAPAVARVTGEPRALPPGLFGVNGANLSSNRQVFSDPAFVAAVGALHPGAIRLFAGTTANYWDWRTGTFVDSPDVPASLRRQAGAEEGRVTLEDWAALVRAAGAVPVYDLNLVTSTLDDQLAMLRQAAELGLPVTRVELGNELWDDDPVLRERFPDGAAYGRIATQWAAAIKQAFPGVQVAVSGYSFAKAEGSQRKERRTTWNDGLFSTMSGIDAVAFHQYFPSGRTGSGPTDAAAAGALFGAADGTFGRLSSRELDRLPAGVTAWVTEWSTLDRDAPYNATWTSGLAAADYALDLALAPRVTQTDYHALGGGGAFAAIYGGRQGLQFDKGDDRAIQGPADPPKTTPFALSAAGLALQQVFAATDRQTQARRLELSPAPTVGDAGDTTAGLSGLLLQGAPDGPAGLLLNLTGSPVTVTLPAELAGGLAMRTLAASPDTYVVDDTTIPLRTSTSAAAVTLPPLSLTRIGGR